MTKIKIIYDKNEGTGGDQISHHIAHFANNPTLREFVDWLLSCKREWGEVETKDRMTLLEYKHGEIVFSHIPESQYDNQINLLRVDGGWSRYDYTIEFQ